MKIEAIEGMLSSGMVLRSWDDSESSGIWVAIGEKEDDLEGLQDKINGGLKNNIELKTYFHSDGDWLPIVLSDSLSCALKGLEIKLGEMPLQIRDEGAEYRQRVSVAYSIIIEDDYLLKIAQ